MFRRSRQEISNKNVKFEIQVKDLGFVNYQNKHVVETGKFDLMVGSLKSELIIK